MFNNSPIGDTQLVFKEMALAITEQDIWSALSIGERDHLEG